MAGNSHSALVVSTLDSYVVSCSCGWIGASHGSPEPAKQEAKDHEDNPGLVSNGRPPSSPPGDD